MAFRLSSAQQSAVREPLRLLLRLRDEAVHPATVWVEPVLHATFNVGMEPRFIRFRAENAVNAQLLARKAIKVCLGSPKVKYSSLVEWCEGVRNTIPVPPEVPEWADGTQAGTTID